MKNVITNLEADRLRNAAFSIWQEIGVDVAGSVREAESYDPEEIIEVAFDAGRLWERDPELDELWRTMIDLIGYDETRSVIANSGIM